MSIPKSLILLPIAVAVFAVQLFPLAGIVMVLVFAPFWPIFLINGAAVGTALEVWLRDENGPSRMWLLVPILWFGGYLGLFVSEQFAVSALRAETEAANRGAPLGFDPRIHALVFDRVGSSVGLEAADLVRSGQLPVVYARQRPSSDGQIRMVGYRLMPPSECARMRGSPANLAGAGIQVRHYGNICVLEAPETPTGAIVELSGRDTHRVERGLDVRGTTLTLTMPNGASRQVVTGWVQPLGPIPMPVAGCVIHCEVGFWRQRLVHLASDGPAVLVAAALGLGPARQAETMSAEQARSRLGQAETAAIQHDVDALERVLANPAAPVDNWFSALRQYPERLAPYAGRMVAALERAVQLGDPARENGRNLSRLIALLPPDSFRSVGGRVLALLPPLPSDNWYWGTDELIARTGDLGEAAMPLLLARLERSSGRAWKPAVIGLCRVGAPAAARAGPRLLSLWRADSGSHDNHGGRSGDEDRAIYAALLRLGLRDTVGEVRQGWQGRWFAAAWRDINPSVSPERCDPDQRVDR